MSAETVLSLAAIVISLIALYRSSFHRGSVRMTQPTPLLLSRAPSGLPRISLVTMLLTTGAQGHVIESIFVRLRRGGAAVVFPQWSYAHDKETSSAGLYVPSAGMSLRHEFVGPPDSPAFQFTPGQYVLEVFATLMTSKKRQVQLDRSSFTLPPDINPAAPGEGIILTWLPPESRYTAELHRNPLMIG